MKAAEILGVDTIRLLEPSFADLTNTGFNHMLAGLPGDQARLLIDEHDEPLALAFHDRGAWTAGSFICRKPSVPALEHFEEVNGEIYQEERKVWVAAVREYYSLQIAEQVVPAVDDLNRDRPAIIEDIIARMWGQGSGDICLDFCCGSGVGSDVLRRLGYAPLSCDNDAALLSRGLVEGRLRSEETMYLDATIASRYFDPVPRGIGIMVGEINSYSQEMWERIIQELFTLSQDTLITVGTEKEAILIRGWGTAMGRDVEVSENPADPIYDRWVCRARPH